MWATARRAAGRPRKIDGCARNFFILFLTAGECVRAVFAWARKGGPAERDEPVDAINKYQPHAV